MLGCRGDSTQLELATTPDDEAAADRAWADLGLSRNEPVVCLNTGGAFGPAKNWPTASFAELARRLVEESRRPVLVLCGPAERDAAREIAGLADHPRVVSLAEQPLSLGLSKACVRRAALLITTDSGPRHFAAAFGTPVITLFGPTHIAWTRTYHPQALHLFRPVPCGPCQRPTCPEGHHRCMRELTPGDVMKAVQTDAGSSPTERADEVTSDRSRSPALIGLPETLQAGRLPDARGVRRVMAKWLITGATGFLGRHVLDALESELAEQRPVRRRDRGARPQASGRLARGCLRRPPISTTRTGSARRSGPSLPIT